MQREIKPDIWKVPVATESSSANIKLSRFKPRWYQKRLIRALFKEGKKRAVCVWSRRCLDGDTHIIMSDGSWKYLKDINIGDKILSHNGISYEEDIVVDHWDAGIKDAIKLNNRFYLPLVSSGDHKFATLTRNKQSIKWKKLDDFSGSTSCLQFQRGISGTVDNKLTAELIGYLQGDGYVAGYQQPKFTNTNVEILNRVDELARIHGCVPIWRKKGNGYDIGLSNGTLGGASKNNIKEIFREFGQDVPKYKQRIHPIIWNMNDESVFRYLSAIISCDASITYRFSSSPIDRFNKKANAEIVIHCGVSEDYAFDMYWLLRKVGISPQRPKCERGSNWKIRISKVNSLKILLNNGPFVGKEEKRKECLKFIDHLSKEYQIHFENYEALPRKNDTDPVHMYDIRTKKNHNFVANGYLVHNSGKDFMAWQLAFWQCLAHKCTVFYVFPTQAQARSAIWSGITIDGQSFLDYIPPELIYKKNEARMEITFVNGSILALKGSNNFDSLRGTNPYMCIFSEYSYQSPDAWTLFLQPVLRANDGIAIFISTPFGKNHLYSLYEIAKNSPDTWYCDLLTVEDTGHIDVQEIKDDVAKGLISEDQMLQEYYCSFTQGVEGSIYGKYINNLRLDNRITTVPHEPGHPVHVAWDLGWNDSTALIWFQSIGKVVNLIDTYECNRKPLEHYVNIIKDKDYTYGTHFLPHDGKNHELIAGISRERKLRDLGLNIKILERVRIVDRIEQARCMFARLWMDETKSAPLIKALENYRREWDDRLKRYKDNPLHDWSSHLSDCFSYMAMALQHTKRGMTQQDADELRRKALMKNTGQGPQFLNYS